MNATMDMTDIRDVAFFAGLSEDELEQVAALIHRTTIPAGTLLIGAQLPGKAVYFILSGSVKLQMVTHDGTEITVAIYGPGDTVGETSLVSRIDRSTSVITRQETEVLWMDRKDFLKRLDHSLAMNRNLIRHLSQRLLRATERIQALSSLDVTGRVARHLLDLAERYGTAVPGEGVRISLPVTQGEIAEMVAATRERVNHVMVRMKRAGVFSVDAEHHITVHRAELLLKLSRF